MARQSTVPNPPSRASLFNLCRKSRAAIVVAVLSLTTPCVSADEVPDSGDDGTGTSTFSFSGFGTLGVVRSSEDQADFTSSIFKANGAGHTHTWSADVDSILGGQLTANFTREISAVVQVIAEQRYDNSYTPDIEWANIKYAFTPDASIRAGRIVLPAFLVSDFRNIGYANPWIRPPLEVYSLVPVRNNDGVDASYRMHFGDVTNTVRASYGSIDAKIADDTAVKGRDQLGVFNTTEYGPLTVHLTYFQSDLTIESTHPLFAAFAQFGPQGVAIAEKYDCDGKRVSLGGIGANYDPGMWFLMAEWAKRTSDCFVGGNTAWYVSGGYRLGKFTPYLTYAQVKADSATSDPGLDASTLPPFLAGVARGLNASLNTVLASTPSRQTWSVGGRWDFMKNVDLKLQYDRMQLGDGSRGTLINIQPGFQPGGRVDVFSVAVDFVF